MTTHPRRILSGAIVCFMVMVFPNASPAGEIARDFLDTYCVDCHNTSDASGERDFESLTLGDPSLDTLIDLQDAIDQLTLGDMPPLDAAQPDDHERQSAIADMRRLTEAIRQTLDGTDGQTVLRRLNRREYLATVGDLFGLDMTTFDPTVLFPADNTVEHLDNVGDVLVTSGFLLEQYLAAADQVIDKIFNRSVIPAEQTWTFRGSFDQQPELRIAHKQAFDFRYMCLYDNPLAERPEGAYGAIDDFTEGVPADGRYEIRVLAAALHRDTPYSEKVLRMELDEPFRLGIRPGDVRIGDLHVMQPIQPLLAETVVPDIDANNDDPVWLTFEVPLDRGMTPRFTFENGHTESRNGYHRVFRVEEYRNQLPTSVRDAKGIVQWRNAVLKHAPYPQIRIHEIQIRGPLTASSSPTPLQRITGDAPVTPARIKPLLKDFASRAYRRPVQQDQLDALMRFVDSRRQAGRSPEDAYQDAIRLVLCSPSFLYFEPLRDAAEGLSTTALASRLSYFLTGSMPDDELMSLAIDGRLTDREILGQQTRRLLSSESSDRFVSGFLDAWLNLRSLGDMPPDRGEFGVYYAKDLQTDMRRETREMMRYLIDENRPVTDFLSCDYTFLNRDLAELYGVAELVPADANAHQFRRVRLSDPLRGGLLGHASVLTVTANGIETSPIIRGVWLLENILGTPPALPPDDVPTIDPDVRGATSIRDLIEKHRASPACAECHRKIDPLGFALESFDAIGQRRIRYENRAPIDTSGELPSGQSFDDLAGLKEILLQRKDFFARMVTEKLYEYALGRRLEPIDRGEVDAVVASLADHDYPMTDLILAITDSDLFRSK